MAAFSLASSTFSHFSPLSRPPNRTPTSFFLSKSISFHNFSNPNCRVRYPIVSILGRTNNRSQISSTNDPKLTNSSNPFSSIWESLLVFSTSVLLSFSLFVTDVDPAAAFIVTTPRKLQTDELATVRLFQENTPSVVYITNLAAR